MGFDNPPVEVGEQLKLKVVSQGSRGDGMAKYKGYCIFIPNTRIGDVVNVEITKALAKVGFGKVVG